MKNQHTHTYTYTHKTHTCKHTHTHATHLIHAGHLSGHVSKSRSSQDVRHHKTHRRAAVPIYKVSSSQVSLFHGQAWDKLCRFLCRFGQLFTPLLCVSVCISVCQCVPVCVSVCISVCQCVSVCVCQCVPVRVSVCQCVSVCISVYQCVSVCISVCVRVYQCVSVWQRQSRSHIHRVGQNHIYAPYSTVYLLISLPKIPYTHRIYMVLASPNPVTNCITAIDRKQQTNVCSSRSQDTCRTVVRVLSTL